MLMINDIAVVLCSFGERICCLRISLGQCYFCLLGKPRTMLDQRAAPRSEKY